jgi:hypothetical protein
MNPKKIKCPQKKAYKQAGKQKSTKQNEHTGVAFKLLLHNGTLNLGLDNLKLKLPQLAPHLFLSKLASRADEEAEEEDEDDDDDGSGEPFARQGNWMCETPTSRSRAAISTARECLQWLPGQC